MKDYEAKKEHVADEIIRRLDRKLFPGLTSSITFREVLIIPWGTNNIISLNNV